MEDNISVVSYKVYAKVKNELVYQIYSTCFKEVEEGDIFIKEGCGDEFVHVGYYQIYDKNGCHNYKIVDDEMVKTTEEEKQEEYKSLNQIDICPEDRPKTNEELTEEQMKMQKIIADLEIDILNKE